MKVFSQLLFIFLCLAFLSSCNSINNPRSSRKAIYEGNSIANDSDGESSSTGDKGATSVSDKGTDINSTDPNFKFGRAEIRHLVDPFEGTYKAKVTIPKNYAGFLYLSGLNIASLTNRLISVRFNFGRELGQVVVQGVIGRAPGITPSTDLEIIQLDLKEKPFSEIRLLYDLYDYNNYRQISGEETKPPVSDNKNGNLYCRGLRLEHDPTFSVTSNDTVCDGKDGLGNVNGERCLYSYAKVTDSGLWEDGNPIDPQIPSEPQININKGSYATEPDATALKKCLPDNDDRTNFNEVMNTTLLSLGYGTTGISLNGSIFDYEGPFRSLSPNTWEISPLASAILSPYGESSSGATCVSDYQCANNCCLKASKTCGVRNDEIDPLCTGGGPTGLFQKSLDNTFNGGYKSFLFPRAGKLDYKSGVEYFGSADPFSSRSFDKILINGESQYIDGCNIRVSNYDSYLNEGIGSCNVSAIIEIITKDKDTGDIEVLSTSSEVKLQLTRASIEDYLGREVLYSSMKTCSNSQACGPSQCCFNNRCWSRELVSQCLEDVDVVGNLSVGENCGTDYECSSLCCGPSTNTCMPHVNNTLEQVFCAKYPGQRCVAKEFCRQENVSECIIVKTPQAAQACSLRCYNVPTFGDCVNGTCIPPVSKAIPAFDPLNPDCTNAVDPPPPF